MGIKLGIQKRCKWTSKRQGISHNAAFGSLKIHGRARKIIIVPFEDACMAPKQPELTLAIKESIFEL